MPKLDPKWQTYPVLETVFDHLSDALLLYDCDHHIVGVNRAAERILGMSADAMVGRSCREIFRCDQCEPNCGILLGIGKTPAPNQATVSMHLQNGMQKTVVVRSAQLLDENGKLAGAVATIRDVSNEFEPRDRTVIAESPLMTDLMHFVRRVALSEATTVLLEGENGVGKDMIATTLHSLSPRQSEPFIAVNCAAIPETLIESELFGYEKGAFTDARQQKRGLFELADNGTLFLDEIGEIPLLVQAKLLRVLEDQTFRRLGGTRDLRVNLRFIAATNKNLREAVREGAFRQDLYFRLNVIQITIPPLRERREDILPLTLFFVEHYNRKFKRHVEGVSEESLQLMEEYLWPGNVRELRNAIERAMILEEGTLISSQNLPMSILRQDISQSLFVDPADSFQARSTFTGNGVEGWRGFPTPSIPATSGIPEPGKATELTGEGNSLSLEVHEIDLLRKALARAGGNQTHAARLLNITRDTLRYKMKKHGM